MRKAVKASKKYWFVWDEELSSPCAFDAFLFNDPAHLALQPCKRRYSYYLIKKHDDVIHARCTFFVEDNKAYSPYRGSFGSIEFSDKVFYEMLEEYWDYLEADLRAKGVNEIFIKSYPVCYNPSHAQTLSFLFSTKGFSIKTQELNFHIEVDDVPFERKVHENERKKLSKALKKGYEFKKEDDVQIEKAHRFIDDCRRRRYYPMTMTQAEMERVFLNFKERFHLYSVSLNEKWVAVSLVITVNKSLLYTFYSADSLESKKDSPLVLLHYNLYNEAKKSHYQIIDLGIGTYNGKPNAGLIRFKEKIGGISSLKYNFSSLKV